MCLNKGRIKNPVVGKVRDLREEERQLVLDSPLSSCHGLERSEAEDTLTMISHSVEISISGGGADMKDKRMNYLFFFMSCIRCLRYKKPHGVLAIVKTKPINNQIACFTASCDKQIPPAHRKAIKQERFAVAPTPYGMGVTAHYPPTKTNGEESIGKSNQEENKHKDIQEERNPLEGSQKRKKRI